LDQFQLRRFLPGESARALQHRERAHGVRLPVARISWAPRAARAKMKRWLRAA